MYITTMTHPATPNMRRAMAFTTFGAGQQYVWGQPLGRPVERTAKPRQHGGADLQKTPTVIGNRSAAKPGSPPRREPR